MWFLEVNKNIIVMFWIWGFDLLDVLWWYNCNGECFIKNNENYKDMFGFENCVLNKKW